MMDKFQLLHIVAGIGWEPEIRGALTVLVGSLVLFGSVWLILNTNPVSYTHLRAHET